MKPDSHQGSKNNAERLTVRKGFVGKAMLTHIYIHNRCPSSILPNNITLYEKVFSHPPSIGHFRVFRYKCFIKVPDEKQSKLDDKALECHLIGFEGDSIYVVVDSDKKKLRSHNVIFMEGKANRCGKNDPTAIAFPATEPTHAVQESMHTGSAYIEEVSESTSNKPKSQRMRSEVSYCSSTELMDGLPGI